MGGHRLPCPYKLAATCPPSLPHPPPRQLAESESDTQTSWRGRRRHTQIFERAHTARLQQRRRCLPASLPSACHMIRVELARRRRPVDRAPRVPFERVHLCLWWSRIVRTDNQRTSSKLLLRQREGTGWAGCGGIATAAANFSSATAKEYPAAWLWPVGAYRPASFLLWEQDGAARANLVPCRLPASTRFLPHSYHTAAARGTPCLMQA